MTASSKALVCEAGGELRKAIETAVPELSGFDSVAIVAVHGGALADMRRLIGELTPPPASVPEPAVLSQARRNAEARASFMSEFASLTAEEIADLVGSTAKNRHETASRLKRARRVFAVSQRGQMLYPAFQFDGRGRPKPVIASLLAAIDLEGWELALWCATPNAWLGEERPVDLLDASADRVVEAAREDSASHVF